ncbi:PREDICTED: zinc finger BED domain-containing protein 4-like [Rhagoletis zephyria]|uniref:zinc finger BED domain-containing protein 4-like n=1 Tax=Rhagoletis zephyria TaxID=28612 RepID=UPI0008112080|nr:PREDICTED: zinc finger BED domain-containing protein 4-like [Rhagoletis zephyria]XP_036340186.1 zinc finger BED domain-containing protein 4-like [Rhagoletis pomonella]
MFAVVTDNGGNIVRATIDTFGETKYLSCLAHSVNLVMQSVLNAIEAVKNLIAKIKKIVMFFGQSNTAVYKLREAQAKDEYQLCLIQDCPTRWNSTFDMIQRFLVLLYAVTCTLLSLDGSPQMIFPAEVNLLKELVILLKPAKEVTLSISGEKYATGNKVLMLIDWFRTEVKKLQPISDVGKVVKTSLMSEIKKRLGCYETIRFQSLIGVAALFDPRFKRSYFPNDLYDAQVLNLVSGHIHDLKQPNSQKRKTENLQADCSNSTSISNNI